MAITGRTVHPRRQYLLRDRAVFGPVPFGVHVLSQPQFLNSYSYQLVAPGAFTLLLVLTIALVACVGTEPGQPSAANGAAARAGLETEVAEAPSRPSSAPEATGAPFPQPTVQEPLQTPTRAAPPAPTPAALATLTDSRNGCPPVPDPGPDAYVIETVELNKVSPGMTKSYLAACLEGAWRLMAQLSELGQLNQVGIAVVDSGIYQPNDTPTARKLALRHEFDWDRILVADMVQNRTAETEEEHIVRSHHGAAVTSVIAAVNHTDKSDLPPEFPQDTSFSGALTSVPNFPYRIYFFEHTATGEKLASFEIIKDALDRIREYGPTIDVVNLSLGLQCDPTDGPIVYNNCVYNPANLFRQTNWYRNKIRDIPEIIFVVGAGNIGQDAGRHNGPSAIISRTGQRNYRRSH